MYHWFVVYSLLAHWVKYGSFAAGQWLIVEVLIDLLAFQVANRSIIAIIYAHWLKEVTRRNENIVHLIFPGIDRMAPQNVNKDDHPTLAGVQSESIQPPLELTFDPFNLFWS